MGAINYATSDYITLGIVPYSTYDLEQDPEFMQKLREEVEEYGGTVEEALYDCINNWYALDYENITHELNKHNFHYFHIKIEPGYYEGFTLGIENSYAVSFDYYEQRQEAQKEITEIKQFLIDCAGFGLVACYTGWCMGYEDYNGTIAAIKEAIKQMREEVKATPTWRQYLIACGEYHA